MKMRTLAAASAALGLMASASAANAAISAITSPPPVADDLFGTTLAANNQYMLWDFDSILNPSTLFTGNVLQGPQTGTDSASPPYGGSQAGDTTKYGSVQAGNTSTFAVTAPGYYLTSFSFYLGSPDAYNTLTFNLTDGTSQTLLGSEIWGGVPDDPQGNRNMGFRVYYDFDGAKVQSITFGTGNTNAFEFDGLAGAVTVPEPGTWALMIMGFGGAGAMLRRRKAALA